MPTGNAEDPRTYPLRVPGWHEIPDLVHGFLGRAQGLAPGDFGRGDLETALRAGGERPVQILAARQVHGSTVLAPENLDAICANGDARMPDALPDGDAIVTASADVIATIRTADCVPVLLVAPRARAAAAIHAGWRGLVAGVIRTAIEALGARYGAAPNEIQAAIGPAIGGCCYEFGTEHRATFVEAFGPTSEQAWSAAPDNTAQARPHLDVGFLAHLALTRAGVAGAAIQVVSPCTAEHPDELHSYRRDGAAAGRQLSYIGWRSA